MVTGYFTLCEFYHNKTNLGGREFFLNVKKKRVNRSRDPQDFEVFREIFFEP